MLPIFCQTHNLNLQVYMVLSIFTPISYKRSMSTPKFSKSLGWLVSDGGLHPPSKLRRLIFHFLCWPTKWYTQGWAHQVEILFVDIHLKSIIFSILLVLTKYYCLGLLFSPGLRTRAGQPAEDKSKVKTAKNTKTRGKKSFWILEQKSSWFPEQKSYRIHIWCCESPILPRPP